MSSNGPDACHTGIGHFNTRQFIPGAERGVAKAGLLAAKVLVSVLVFQVAIGVANEASLRIWTLEASPGEPTASRPSDWQTAPMPLAPVGTERLDPTPAARYFHALAYDSHADRVILFGGFLGYWFNDTWAYDFNTNTWTNMAPAVSPPADIPCGMAYDAQSDRMILIVGCNGGASTWAYDFSSNMWTNMNPAARPSLRSEPAMTYDTQADRVILFGGRDQSGGFWPNDTWAYDFSTNTWTNMAPVVSPPGRSSPAMAYDSTSGRVILFSGWNFGTPNDTWAYDFNVNNWTRMDPPATPSPRSYHAMAYDSESDRVILFGGEDTTAVLGDTWAYDFNSNGWTNADPPTRPVRRVYHAMAYDSESDRVILFGGSGNGDVFNDTWAYDFNLNTWTDMDPAVRPPPRYGHAMAYDSQSDRVILFSGYGLNGNYFDDTWAYDFNANKWTNKDPLPKPPMRYCHATAYDAQSDRVILFGGDLAGGLFNDTWAYDFNTNAWTDMAPGLSPPATLCDAMAYDSESDRVILFGGYVSGVGVSNDTWAYDFNTNTWTNLDPPAKPPVRYEHAMAYDSGSDRLIMFGGAGSSGYFNDTWAYDFNKNTWTNASASPSARYSHAMVYDSQTDRVILFGGYSVGPGSGYLNDTWAYDFNTNAWTSMDHPVPLSAPQRLTTSPGNTQVRLDWQAPASTGGSTITGYNVYRGVAAGSLTLLSSLGNVLTYQDAGLTNGVAYYYQVSAQTAAGEGPRSSEVAATPRTQPSAVRNLLATAGAGRVVLTWDAPISDGGATVSGYSVYRGTAPGSSALFATVGNVLTYADDAVTNGATYYYQAAALNIAGEGPRSNEVSATPTAAPDSTPPTAAIGSLPNNTVVNSTTITLTGTASDNVAIEKVEVSADGSTWILATGTTSWSATLTLREGQNTIFVRTTDTSGNVSITTFTVTVELASLTLQGTSSLAIDRVAGGAAVTAAIVVGVYVSSSVGSGSSGVSAASGGMTHKGIPLPWKRLRRFLLRRKRGAEQVQVHDRLLPGSSKNVVRPSRVVQEAATTLGLKARGPWLFGRLRGFPVVAKESGISDRHEVLFQVALTPEAIQGVTTAISDKKRLKSLGLQPAGMRIEPSVSELVYDHRPIVRTKPADVVRIFEALAVLASEGGPALGDRCEKCREKPGGDVMVVNGLPTQLCAADFEALRAEGEHAEAVAKGLRPAYAKGVAFGLAGMVLGSMIWAAIGILSGYVLSFAAFGISVIVARLLAKGAGRLTTSLAALMVLLTMLAIFLGDVTWAGVVVAHVSGPFDLLQAVEAYIGIVRRDPFVLLSYPSSFLGILVSVAAMRRHARRAPASFEVIS